MLKMINPTHGAHENSVAQGSGRSRSSLYKGLALALAALTPGLVASSHAQDRLADRMASAQTIERLTRQRLSSPLQQTLVDAGTLDPAERVNVLVRLSGDPAARLSNTSPSSIQARKAELNAQQSAFLARAEQLAPGFRSITATQMVLNAVILEVDAGQMGTLLGDDDVDRVTLVANYDLDLSETVPYIGATAVQNIGVDGSGVKVAVFDSGIDYYHADLGGSGDVAEYQADNPNIIEPGSFPTAKVAGGFDFTGSVWPDGPEIPDPDPLDDGPAAGHGTHVADIIAGVGGVAPGADLYSVKVCSSISPSCSGIALIQGMEFAVDPNGDGDTSDAMDIINMSLGSTYGQPFDDDLSAAVDSASALGVLTVASAGNSSDKPYITGTPSAAPTALSVAQTQVPSAELPFINVDGTDYASVFQAFSVAPQGVVGGDLQYADGAGGNLQGCEPFVPGSLDGLTVLVDRGGCEFGTKILNVGEAGAAVGIIGLVAPGDPFSGGAGADGSSTTIPGYMVSQSDSNAMKGQLGLLASVDPDAGLPLVATLVGSSSRGPSNNYNQAKPEIGAPGASVSAVAGTGTGTEPFGGTSGAAPMVAGSAALLMSAEPDLANYEVKARLINTGDTDINTDAFSGPAPITRIGGGEVRADNAVNAATGVWDKETKSGALSFGFVDAYNSSHTLERELEITNYSDDAQTYDIAASFRDPADAASGAISVAIDSSVTVAPGSSETVAISMTINSENLPNNTMSSGSQGANPASLNAQEFDGYLTFTSAQDSVHVPWQVLPRKSANIKTRGSGKRSFGSRGRTAADGFVRFGRETAATLDINNLGVGTAQNEFFALVATSSQLPEGGAGEQSPTPDIRAVGVKTFRVPPSFCSSEFLWEFAINTWERQTHLLPIKLIVSLDTDQDGTFDFQISNNDFSAFQTGALNTIDDGRQLTLVLDLETGNFGAFFFAEHATNTGNTVLTVCGEQLGLTADDILTTNVDIEVQAFDFYFGGPGDLVDGITIAPLGERYVVTDGGDVEGGESATFNALDFGVLPGNTDEEGLLMFSNRSRLGNTGGAREGSEAMILQRR